jgi:outer membrane receptor for ferrienterochelin and colicins
MPFSKRYILLIVWCCISNLINATNNICLFFCNNNYEPVAKADVNIYCNGKFTAFKTDSNGIINIAPIYVGCKLTADAVGYEQILNYTFVNKNVDTILLKRKNTQLNEFVITGVHKDIITEKSLYKINVLNEATIKQQAANNLAELLTYQTSFFTQTDNFLGNTINMQGLGGQNIKILINGIPVNGRENGNIDLAQFNLNNVDRVELVKGPMSVLYGTDALGGVINIITKKPLNKKNIKLSNFSETINRHIQQASINYVAGRHLININASRTFCAGIGYTDTFNRAQTWKPKLQHQADANYTYKFSKGVLQYKPTVINEKIINRGTPKVDPFGAFAIDDYYITNRLINTIALDVELDSNNKLTVNNTVSYYNRIKNQYTKNLQTLSQELTRAQGSQDTSSFIDYNSRGVYYANKGKDLKLLFGYEINYQNALSLKLYKDRYAMLDYAIFAAPSFSFNKDKWVMQPSLRIASNNFYKVPITPSLLIKGELNKNVIFRASYTRGYRAPTLKELYLFFVDANHNVIGNEELDAETSHQVQMHLDGKLPTLSNTSFKYTVSTYFNTIKKQIALALINANFNAYQYVNIDNFSNACTEVRVESSNKHIKQVLGTSINHILTADSGKGFTNVDLTSATSYTCKPIKTVFNINYRYISKQVLLGVNSIGENASYNAYLPATHWLDANASKNFLANKLQLQIGVKNILNIGSLQVQGNTNTNVHGNNGIQQMSPGRSIFLNAQYSF